MRQAQPTTQVLGRIFRATEPRSHSSNRGRMLYILWGQQPGADALQQNPKRKRVGRLRRLQPGADALHFVGAATGADALQVSLHEVAAHVAPVLAAFAESVAIFRIEH